MGTEKLLVGELIPRPSAYTESAVLEHRAGDVELRCTYERQGSLYMGGARFLKVRAYRYRSEGHSTSWHSDGAYDQIVEVTPSGWVDELRAAAPRGNEDAWVLRHFLVFIDSAGAYEFVCAQVEWLTEEPARS